MNPNDVIEAFVADVMRRVPGNSRGEIGLELRGLLSEMLDGRAADAARAADDAMVLAMLREFGTPAEIASRYREPGAVIIPAEQTRSFALLSVGAIVLQWALTLPRVFSGEQDVGVWWLSWGLGAFWWPGFMVMMSLIALGVRALGFGKPVWRPRVVDPMRVNRGALGFGLALYAIGAVFMIALPWTATLLPEPLVKVFAFDAGFLTERAWPVLVLWGGGFATLTAVLVMGRSTPMTKRLELGFSFAFAALLIWWMTAGPIFTAPLTDEGAKGALALVVLIIAIDVGFKLYSRPGRIRAPRMA